MFNWSLNVLLERLAVIKVLAPVVAWIRARIVARMHGYNLHTADDMEDSGDSEAAEDIDEEELLEEIDADEENPFEKKMLRMEWHSTVMPQPSSSPLSQKKRQPRAN